MIAPNEINLAQRHHAMRALAAERERLGIGLLDLEDGSGISVNSFYAWQSGYRAPKLPSLVALAQFLGFEVLLIRRSAGTANDAAAAASENAGGGSES